MKQKTTLFRRMAAGVLSAVLVLGAFAAAPLLPDSPFSLSAQAAATEDGQFEYSVESGQVTITKYKGDGENVTIPSAIDGQPVTVIGEYAFFECISLTSVTIPASVKTISEYSFYNCTSLTSVTIPNGVMSIGWAAFSDCTSLPSVTIPASVTSIDQWAFANCTSMTSIQVDSSNKKYASQDGVLLNKEKTELLACPCGKNGAYTIPNSVTTISTSAFYYCSGLTSVTIPEGVTSIGYCVFYFCSGLASVTIPGSVMSIGDYAFYSCSSLSSVTIPNSATAIGEVAFGNCASLSSVTISSSVTNIGQWAFANCSALTAVTIPDSVTNIGWDAFDVCPNLTIYGKSGSYAETYAAEMDLPFVPVSFQNTSTLSKTTVPKLTVVTVTGASEYGTGNVTYAFYYKKSTSKTWTSMGEKFGNTKEVSFIPNMAATYQVMVKAKDEGGQVVTKMMTLTATKPTADDLVNVSTISKTEAKKGEAIALTGKATGGQGKYNYAFYYKKGTSKTFTPVAEPYSGKTKVYFKPAYATEYTVRILVKDEAGTVAVKEYKVNVTK